MNNIIARWWQSMGFGIQSKTDFAFLHDVLREKHLYYAYEEIRVRCPEASRRQHRMAQLFFRVCNHVSPAEVRYSGQVSKVNRIACEKAVSRIRKDKLPPLLFAGENGGKPCLDGLSAIIVTHIDTSNRVLWKKVLSSSAITYDMENVGIALFRENRYSEHYAIRKMW